jgi:hypothetical protein
LWYSRSLFTKEKVEPTWGRAFQTRSAPKGVRNRECSSVSVMRAFAVVDARHIERATVEARESARVHGDVPYDPRLLLPVTTSRFRRRRLRPPVDGGSKKWGRASRDGALGGHAFNVYGARPGLETATAEEGPGVESHRRHPACGGCSRHGPFRRRRQRRLRR